MKCWRFWRSAFESNRHKKSPVSCVETPVQKKGVVPPEVQYLSDDSIVKALPLSSFVVTPPQQGR